MRHKGAQPIAKEVCPYNSEHPVARWIADGDHWLTAWVGQMATSWHTITRKIGITDERLEQFNDDEEVPADSEIEALAALWYVTPDGLRESIRNGKRIRRRGGRSEEQKS